MVLISPPLPALAADTLSLFHSTDDLLAGSHVLIFYGLSSTATASVSSSRIQAHIFSPTGLQSYPRLTISPSSPLYAAVECLPREEQGDEICRGLAFTLFKYFSELPEALKDAWIQQLPSTTAHLPSAPKLFSEAHAALIASRMLPVVNSSDVVTDLKQALAEQSVSWVDMDVVLPVGTMKELDRVRESIQFDDGEDEVSSLRYGEYASVVRLFGQLDFLPTSRLKRAPSRPTAINRSLTFPRQQKENLRREMCEFLDTEENYVSKIDELVNSIAADFRQKAAIKSTSSSSPTEKALRGLFPPSIDQILEANTGFLEAIRTVCEDTENDAIQDIESTVDSSTPYHLPKDAPDVTGAHTFAKTLLDWFPKFGDSYAAYMQAQADFGGFLRMFTKETGSSFSKRVHETGEQRLMSMLIEPVQRLPRYNLYIDNLVKQLPFKHPALKPLLKARDVISEICSRDAPGSEATKVLETLRRLVPTWPSHFRPSGRLVTAIDVVELPPPFCSRPNDPETKPGILLLFLDCIVLLRKPSGCTKTARAIIAEIDNPNQTAPEPENEKPVDLKFHHRVKLSSTHVSELSNGSKFQLFNLNAPNPKKGRPAEPSVPRVFYLTGPYEGKATKWVEEVIKARVEGRFPETERESHKWEVRTSLGSDLNVFSAVFEDSTDTQVTGRKEPASIRIVIDPKKGSKTLAVGQDGVDIVAHLTPLEGDFFTLELASINNYGTRDHLTSAEFLPVLKKRVSNLLQMRYHVRNTAITAVLLLRNQQILNSLEVLVTEHGQEPVPGKQSRPHSPVKMLTNLFSGSSHSSLRIKNKSNPILGEIPRMAPPPKPNSRPGSRESKPSSREGLTPSTPQTPLGNPFGKVTVGVNGDGGFGDQLGKLEETLASYILSLHARKGNVVGKVLRARSSVDEAAVNELYNTLLEDPQNVQMAAVVPVDVLFSAFEKFLHVAWKETIGEVISLPTLSALQSRSDTASQPDFEDFFRYKFSEISPQNQRALRAIIQLLAELLEGTSSDSDRGLLTASFTEVLVPGGDPHAYISLIDRLVEDIVALFKRPGSSGAPTPMTGSVQGSINSNASSLRKRFGLGLSRENSKIDSESKLGSVWRTLSKNKPPSQPSSIDKPTLGRSLSTDHDAHGSRRPTSREKPTLHGSFTFEGDSPAAGRSWFGTPGSGLQTIGEGKASVSPRKKRRSSLSDLPALQNDASQHWSSRPTTPRSKIESLRGHFRQSSASPRSPSPTKVSNSGSQPHTPSRLGSPLPARDENSPSSGVLRARLDGIQAGSPTKGDQATTPHHSIRSPRKSQASSGIPTLKAAFTAPAGSSGLALTERPAAGNTGKLPTSVSDLGADKEKTTSPAKRLRMQSPQKLRERLNNENVAISSAETGLAAELSKIGDELGSLSLSSSPSKTSRQGVTSTAGLASRVRDLEAKVHTQLSDISQRNSQLAKEMDKSLASNEARTKKLDELYREANAENEALYGKFNQELTRMARNVKGGDGVEEIKKKLQEALEEQGTLRREVWRLRREAVGSKPAS